MEENQITCPQCGLVNNVLADVCVQCGIIFVKNPAQKAAAAALDDEKRKSIEATESILDETQPPAELVEPNSETTNQLDPMKETVMIRIPKLEDIPPLEAESSDSGAIEPEAEKETQNAEIEIEAIETAMETVTEATDAESLFLSDVKADESTKPVAEEMAEKPADPPEDPLKASNQTDITDKSVSAVKDNQDSKAAEDTIEKKSEAGPMAADASPDKPATSEPENKQSEPAGPVETDAALQKPEESTEFMDKSTPKAEEQPAEQEIQLEAGSKVKPDERNAAQAEAPASNAALEKKAETDAEAKQEAQKARNEALKKQQEALLKAEARKKEEAAQAKAAAVKKKKLAQAKAEALKKQKSAQAKAEALKKKKAAQAKALALKKQKANQAKTEALKKQKAAQVKAEQSAETIEVAAGSQSNYVKLLGLLKRYKGKAIGINYDNSAEIKEAELVEANEEFFSVMVKEKKVQYSYPLKTILTIVEGEQGVETGEDGKKAKFDAVIKVYPLVLF